MGIINDQRFLKGIFSIILIAAFVTIFELVFYVIIVKPLIVEQVNMVLNTDFQIDIEPIPDQIENRIRSYEQRIAEQDTAPFVGSIGSAFRSLFIGFIRDFSEFMRVYTTLVGRSFGDRLESFAMALERRELELMQQTTNYSYAFIGIEIVFLFFILFVISRNIKFNNRYSRTSSNPFIKVKNSFVNFILDPSIVTAFITIILLISFQVLFYFYGLNYGYPSLTELQNRLLTNLENAREKGEF